MASSKDVSSADQAAVDQEPEDLKIPRQLSQEKVGAAKETCKRHFNPKHQCRLCGATVCSACSPNSLKLEEGSNAQRVCNLCVEIVPQQTDLARRLDALTRYLETHVGRPSESSVLEPSRSVEEALGRCEGLQRALGEERMRLLAKLEEATEAAANRARIARAQLEEDGGYAENWVSHGARSQSTFLSAHSREVSDRNKCCIDRGQCVLQ